MIEDDRVEKKPNARDEDTSRREAILRMAAYTAPAMLAVLTSEKAMAVSPIWTPPVESE
jgi:hypothetical protein